MGDELEHNPKVTRSALAGHHRDAFVWALSLTGYDRAMAADVLQQTYLLILEGRATFEGRSSLKTWLFGVVRYTASRQRRFRRREFALVSRLGREPTAVSMEDAPLQDERIATALAALPQRQRDVLHLVIYADLTLEETATVLGISLGSVRTHYHRAKQSVRVHLEQQRD